MELVLPQPSSLRPSSGRAAQAPNDEVLSLTIKPVEARPAPLAAAEAPAEVISEPELSKRIPRRFQALSAAGPARTANRFSRLERKPDAASPDGTLEEPKEPEIVDETRSIGPQLHLPSSVVAALARAEETAVGNPVPAVPLTGIADHISRKGKERRGVPQPLQERRVRGDTEFDW